MQKYLHTCINATIVSLTLFGVQAEACNRPCMVPGACSTPGLYLGAFGGGGNAVDSHTYQYGTALFREPPVDRGPLGVDALGTLSSHSTWLAGANLGYSWKNPCSWFNPAMEMEGFYLSSNLDGTLDTPSTALPEHLFDDSFTANIKVFLINSVLSFKNPIMPQVVPYVGVGIGGALISLSDAESFQKAPPPGEPGVNHFSAKTSSQDSSFAGQVKLGLNYMFTKNWSLFAEYRFLYLGANHYNFGSTVFPGHAVTTSWGVNVDSIRYNLGVAGIQFSV